MNILQAILCWIRRRKARKHLYRRMKEAPLASTRLEYAYAYQGLFEGQTSLALLLLVQERNQLDALLNDLLNEYEFSPDLVRVETRLHSVSKMVEAFKPA